MLHTILLYYLIQLSCCKFWPDESARSVKYGSLTISHIATTPRPDWEMTTMQVVRNSKVPTVCAVLYILYHQSLSVGQGFKVLCLQYNLMHSFQMTY